MKLKITLLLLLIALPLITYAQTVSGVATNTGCPNGGIITSSNTGLGASPQYQLLKDGVVIAPISGDATQFTNVNVFAGLGAGNYTVNGRSTIGGTVYSSSTIVVVNTYTTMTIATPTKVAGCVGGTAVLTSTASGGRAPFTYKIATQAAPGTILQNSGAIMTNTFSFNAIGVNNYIISITDSCGQTITGATSVSNPTVTVNDFKLGTSAYPTFVSINNCATPINIYNETLFQYSANSTTISVSDAAKFSWKVKYQGQLYGQDTDGDGYSDIGGAGYSPLQNTIRLPVIATKASVLADIDSAGLKAVLIDDCGNTKEFAVTQVNNGGNLVATNCAGTGLMRIVPNRLSCYPLNVTFTNIANAADVINATINSVSEIYSGFTAGATYHVTYVDAQGGTTRSFDSLPVSQNITIPAANSFSIAQYTAGVQQNLNALGYGRLVFIIAPIQTGDILNYKVTASDNPLVPVGYTGTAPLSTTNSSVVLPRVNATDPVGYWPSGNYTIEATVPCGTKTINTKVLGYNASLTDYTTTAVCGGFNYVMNGTFDTVSAYQVIIVSGPSSVGQTRDLASTTASLPFNGLSYGTYVFGLRIKGGVQNVLTQTVTYNANNAIIVDKTNTGGYVCANGATNGTLTIAAISNSPAPGNLLEYAISLDDGLTFSAYQSGNTFAGLTNKIYFFKVKDGCGNIITQSAQIGVAAAPDATADGMTSPVTICNLTNGTIQLDVNVFDALSYLWSGPGINSANEGLKNPVINYSDLSIGGNNFSCSVTLGAPCNSTTISNLTINVNAAPNIVVTNPPAVCSPDTVDITDPAITAGSDPGLIYTYFSEETATIPVADPTAIATDDIFYIKGTDVNGCSTVVPVAVTINALPTVTIAYLGNPYCQVGTASVGLPTDALLGIDGTYTSDAGLVINASTGDVDLAASAVGSHTVTYSFTDGFCSNTTTTDIIINALPVATISYISSPYCNRGTANVTTTGTIGGAYYGDVGLIIDELTGTIDLSASTVGNHIVTYTFSDGSCSNTTSANIIINETTLPSVLPDATGQCSVTPIVPTVTDTCSGLITATTTTIFPITTQGTTIVSWTFDYGNGYIRTADQNIIITDTTVPIAPILINFTAECSATPTVPTAVDNCSGIITGTTTTIFPITTQGTTVVTWSFDDGNGNISTADQNIIITDTTAPVAPILTDFTAECSATPTAPTAVDNCSGIITGTTTTIFPITTQGTTIVTWSFDDGNGNVSTADQNIIIIDTTAPVVPVLGDFTAECSASPTAPTAVDNCSGTITGTTTTIFPITTQGTTVVTWSFDDGNGNISTTDQNIIITDTTAPVAPILTDFTAECSATPIAPTAVDACSGTITGTTATIFPITTQGTTIVTWSFDDGNGNISTVDQNIIITDTTSPVAPILTNFIAECSATPITPTAVDNCSGTITGTTTTIFPITMQGTTIVTWSFDDGNGNISTADQNVIITDTTAPVVTVLADFTAECSATPTAPTAVDNCSGTITGTTTTTIFPITMQGTTVVTWSFDDGNSNVSTADQNIVITDTTAPVPTVVTDFTAECSATPTAPTAVDNCSGIITGTTTTIFPITTQGTTVVTWSFDDGNGNVSTADQNIIIKDTTAPVAPVLTDITAECSATPTAPTAVDNCSGIITGTTTTIFPITTQGTTVVTWSFDDGNGNVATADQNIIIKDTTAPVAPILTEITAECSVTPTAPTAVDACSGTITGTTTTIFPITTQGTTVVTWSFDDGNSNVSTADQNIVITDTTAPVAPVLTNFTAECSATPIAPTAVDACSGTITGTTTTIFPVTTQGTTIVTWNFDDGNGNISTADQNIIITDTTAPVAPVLTDFTTECSATPIAPTAVDNCSGIITGTTTTIFPIATQGTTVVTWTFDDGNGNISNTDQNIIISDITAPVVPILTDFVTECSATPTTPTAVDACSGTITGTTTTIFPIATQGTTVVTWTFDDGNGNISNTDQNVILTDTTAPVVPILADITGQCSVTPTIPTAFDTCAGTILGTTTSVFPITAVGTTVITWTFNDGNGNSITANQNVIISNVTLAGPESTICAVNGSGYILTFSVNGSAPFSASGTGAPGTWSGNTWTSNSIMSGTNYNVNVQDVNACNIITVSGTGLNCCAFEVSCPTFPATSINCYDELPTVTSLTIAQFEALGNGDGSIGGEPCGLIEITASNGADPGCNETVTITYTVTEYDDLNGNNVRDIDENTVINSTVCTQSIVIHDTIDPVFAEPLPNAVVNADCGTIPPAITLTATDNCGPALVNYSEIRVDGECTSRYSLVRTWTAIDNCENQTEYTQTINVSCFSDGDVYNAISPNGDGKNDIFKISGIDCYPNNTVKIYNRYGVVVYEKEGYDNVTNPFEGYSDGHSTVKRGDKLPTGTYFYTLQYNNAANRVEKSGYLYISNQ